MSETAEQYTVSDSDKRAAWLEARKSAIGASEVAAVLGISPWSTPWEVWADKTGKLDEWSGNKHTRAGNVFERAVLDKAEEELGTLQRDVRVVASGLPLASTCDALVVETGRPVEAKTTGITGRVYGDWGDALTEEIPEYYLTQVHAQLICTGAELAYLFALIAGRGVVEFHVERNEKLNEVLGNKIADWWHKHIVLGEEPSREVMPALDVVKRLRKVANKTIALKPEVMELVDRMDRFKELERQYKEGAAIEQTEILLALGDAEAGLLPDGKELTYFKCDRKGYTVEPTSYRTLRIRKSK